MTPLAVQNLITSGLTTFGSSVLVIIGSTLTIGIAYLVFRFGWHKTKNSLGEQRGYSIDRSLFDEPIETEFAKPNRRKSQYSKWGDNWS